MDEEKREEDLLEEDEDDDLVDDVMKEDSSDNSQNLGSTAEDAVSKEDTFTGSAPESPSDSSNNQDDTVTQPSVESDTNTQEDHSHSHGEDTQNDHHLKEHDSTHSHDHAATINQNKPWESRTVNIESESKPEDDGMGTGAHTGSDDHISINKDDFWKYVKIIVVIAALILGYNYFMGDGGITGDVVGDGAPTAQPPAGQPPVVERVEVSIDDDAVKGDDDAPVTIVEFSDYECPFCARFYTQTLSQLDEQYIKTGKVKLVYRDYPLSFHQQAQKAGEAAECAGEQGKYYEMHDKLFENGVAGGVDSFKTFAGQIGLDQAEFDECLDSGAQASEVQKDFADGSSYGVQGTPAFFINGKLLSGAQPFAAFKAAIDAELA